jgi:hypothetical protein
MRKSQRAVTPRHEALYRGYCIEGTKDGECTILHVIPTRPKLPSLDYSRFRCLPRGTWPKALEVVCGYIDQALGRVRPVPGNKNVEVEDGLAEGRAGVRTHSVAK